MKVIIRIILQVLSSALVCAFLLLVSSACTLHRALASEPPFESLYSKAGKLRKGMSPKEVQGILGLPSNSPHEPVWLWISATETFAKGTESWKSLAERDHEGGVFLVFLEAKLVLPSLRSLAVCGPDEILMEHGDLGSSQIEDIYKLSPQMTR